MLNERNQIEYTGILAVDITRLKQAESELKTACAQAESYKNLLSAFIDNAPNLVLATDTNGQVTLANKAFSDIYRSTEEEICGNTIFKLQETTDGVINEKFIETNHLVVERMKPVSVETTAYHPLTKKLLHMNITSFPLITGGCITGVGTILTDITALIEQNEALSRVTTLADHYKQESEYQGLLMQTYLDQLPYSTTIVDLEGKVIFANKCIIDFWNIKREIVTGMALSEFVTSKSYAARLLKNREYVLSNKKAIEQETSFSIPGKDEQTFITNMFPLLDNDGSLVAIGILRVDITDRKKIEIEREKWMSEAVKAQEFLNTVIDNVPSPIFYKDTNCVYTGVNQAFCKFLGKTKEELVGKTVFELNADKNMAEKWHQMDMALLHDQNLQVYEYQSRAVDGIIHDLIYRKDVFYTPDGKLGGIIGVMLDITERKQAEENLRQSEQRYRSLYNNTPAMLYSIDGEGKLVRVSDYWLETMGYTREEVIGRKSVEFLTEASRKYAMEMVLPHFLETGSCMNVEYQYERKDGSVIDCLMSAILGKETDGQIVHSLAVMTDITKRKQVERELWQNEQLLQSIMDNIPQSIFWKDTELMYLGCNQSFAKDAGLSSPLEIVGKSDYDMPWIQQADLYRADDLQVMVNGKAKLGYEKLLTINGGDRVWLSINKVPLRDKAGNVYAVLGTFENITDRKLYELQIEESRKQIADAWRLLQDFLDNIPYQVVMLDKEERIVIINRTFADEFKSTQQELTGKYYPEYIDAQLQDIAKESNEYVLRNVQQITLREQMTSPSGDTVYLSTVKFPVYNSNGEFSYIGIIDADVTDSVNRENELIRMQEEIERSRQFLQAFMDNASSAMFAKDKEGRYLMVNKKKIEYLPLQQPLLGHTEGEALENPVGRISFRSEDAEVIASGRPMEFYDKVERDHATARYYKTIKFPIYDNQSNFLAVGGITNDITDTIVRENELKEAKGKAEDAASAQERFLASMSHDMRTPLNGIVGMINLMEQTALNTEQKEYMDAMKVSSTNLRVLINDILDISKIQAGKLNIESVLFDLEELLDSIEEVFKHEAKKKQLDFSIRIERGLPTLLEGDPTRLSQILNNLIGNAMKFTSTGFVQLGIQYKEFPDNRVLLTFTVEDSGIGISEEEQERLFQPFSQAGSDTTRRYGGSGLGLSICKSLVELQKGEIGVASEPGKGSTFRFSIPYAKAGQPSKQKEKRKRQEVSASNSFGQFSGLHCLIVEDNLINQKVAFHTLKKNDMTADIANNGREAIDMLRQSPGKYDFILMDIQMPEMDGYQATTVIRNELGLKIPIVAMTASALKGERERCLTTGMNDFVPKPFMIEELLYVIKQLEVGIEPEQQVEGTKRNNKHPEIGAEHLEFEPKKEAEENQSGFGNEPLYDLSNVLMMEDNAFTLDILNTFLETIPEGLQNLKDEVILANDWDKVSAIAHKLKGGVGILQMNKMIEKLAFVELNAKKRENIGGLQEVVDTCIGIYNTVKDEITTIRNGIV
jgi:PAS domain S-box